MAFPEDWSQIYDARANIVEIARDVTVNIITTPIRLTVSSEYNMVLFGDLQDMSAFFQPQWSLDNITFTKFFVNGLAVVLRLDEQIQHFSLLNAGMYIRANGGQITETGSTLNLVLMS